MKQKTLDNQTVTIYLADIRDFFECHLLHAVLPSRQKRIAKYRKKEDQARCLVAGLMETFILGIKTEDDIVLGEHGKPSLKNQSDFYSISHSGNYVVLAVSSVPIGIDIESIRSVPLGVAKRCFTDSEYEMTQQNGADTFFRIWTAKESMMKVTGKGFSLSPETFCVLPLDESAHTILEKMWYFHWLEIDGHMICTVIKDVPQEICIKQMEQSAFDRINN